MNEDQSNGGSGKATWVEKIGKAFSSHPRDRDELITLLKETCEHGIIDADALDMMEGAIEVSETQVRDAMIPRSQMIVVHNDSDLDEFLPQILESGHSRFPVIGEDKDEVMKDEMTEAEEGDLNDLVERTLFLIGHKLRLQEISLEKDFSADVPPVTCDADKIHQALLAILMNAMDAMPDGGVLKVGTRLGGLGEGGARCVEIEVTSGEQTKPAHGP